MHCLLNLAEKFFQLQGKSVDITQALLLRLPLHCQRNHRRATRIARWRELNPQLEITGIRWCASQTSGECFVVLRLQEMLICPVCRHNVEIPLTDSPAAFLCLNCKTALRATLRFRPLFLAAFTIVAITLRMVTLVVSPSASPTKTSQLPVAMESVLARVLWRTGIVQVGLNPSSTAVVGH